MNSIDNKNKKRNAIEVTNVTKIFKISQKKIDSIRGIFINLFKRNHCRKLKALDNVSFEVKKGEFLGIIGHNGAGKSTLLKILAGVYNPNSGRIKINGMVSPFLELGIGFNPELSGRDNVYLNGTVLGLTKKQIDEKFNEIVEFSELENFIDQQLKNYSSGMRVRLAFSVSIRANRDILLMDEVLAVGDSGFREKCLDVFERYRKMGRTVVLVTHSMSTVRKYCDRALLLDNGKVLEFGDVNNVCDEYILSNMTESERREYKKREMTGEQEEKRLKRLRKRWENKEGTRNRNKNEIIEVKMMDEKGKEIKNITRDNKNITIRALLDIKEVNKNDFISFQIINKKNDNIICGANTFDGKFKHGWLIGKNVVELILYNEFLNRGDIYIKAILFRKREVGREILDKYNGDSNREYIGIIPKTSEAGIAYMRHKWKHIHTN